MFQFRFDFTRITNLILIEERAHCSSSMWEIEMTQQVKQRPADEHRREKTVERRLESSRACRRQPLLSFGRSG